MTMENPTNLLTKRADCILYHAHLSIPNEHQAGWIGGNAPEFFDNRSDDLHEGDQQYVFYLSLIHPFKPESMISIFIPEDREALWENNIYPDCSIKVIEYPVSAESSKTTFTSSSLFKHCISNGQLVDDGDSVEQSFLIKVGGNPRLIQHEDYYFAKLQEESLSFFFQVDEDGYPDTLIQKDSSYPFHFGSLYIFAQIGTEVQHPIAGFWQFS